MTEEDRHRWDARYRDQGARPDTDAFGPPALFAPYADRFPTRGTALDLACGRGAASVWLACRGLEVLGVDVSPVAVGLARELAERAGVAARCRFEIADLDQGLPPGPPYDVIVCHMFRDSRLDGKIIERLAPRGILAIAARSEVGAEEPGGFRAAPGELLASFGALRVIAYGEGGGRAWLLAEKASS